MASILKKHLEKRLELKNDPMRTDMSTGASYPKYGFSVGKYTYGYQQFFYEGVNLKEIGAFCSIAQNVTITGSVITKDIPDYAVVAGTPAKIIKYRFSEEEITLLNASQWWNWSDEAIKEHISEFSDKKEFFNTLKSISENKNHKL